MKLLKWTSGPANSWGGKRTVEKVLLCPMMPSNRIAPPALWRALGLPGSCLLPRRAAWRARHRRALSLAERQQWRGGGRGRQRDDTQELSVRPVCLRHLRSQSRVDVEQDGTCRQCTRVCGAGSLPAGEQVVGFGMPVSCGPSFGPEN